MILDLNNYLATNYHQILSIFSAWPDFQRPYFRLFIIFLTILSIVVFVNIFALTINKLLEIKLFLLKKAETVPEIRRLILPNLQSNIFSRFYENIK